MFSAQKSFLQYFTSEESWLRKRTPLSVPSEVSDKKVSKERYIYFLSFIFILFFLFLFHPQAAFTIDIDNDLPTVTPSVTCGGSPLANGGVCSSTSVDITLSYSDLPTGLQIITHNITGDTDTTSCTPTLSTDENNTTKDCTYTVSIPDTAGSNISIKAQATDWAGGQYNAANDAIFSFTFATYSISGTVYVDNNNDCLVNGTDAAYTGLFTITPTAGTVTYPGSGTYQVSNLSSGSHSVTLTVPSGYLISSCNSNSATRVIPPSQTNVDFFINPLYVVSGTVYNDYDHNGVQDSPSDTGRASETLTLSVDGSGTQNTNGSGIYTFNDLRGGGTYRVTANVPSGYKATNGTCSASSCIGGTVYQEVISLSSNTTINFGFTPLFTVQGNIFVDTDKNRLKNGTESNYAGGTSNIAVRDANLSPCSGSLVTWVGTNGIISTATGAYTSGSTLPDGSYDFCYTSKPASYEMTYPRTTPPFFTVSVGNQPIACSVGSHNAATCSSGDVSNLNFGITNSFSWWQCSGGDCRQDNGITSQLPGSSITCGGSAVDPYISTGSNPGIVFSDSINPGLGTISTTNWNVADPFTAVTTDVIRTSYSYLTTTVRQRGASTINLNTVCADFSDCTLPAGLAKGIYTASSSVTLNSYRFTGNKNYIFLINGDLTIKGNIWVDVGSTVVFSTSGNIIIDRAVGNSNTCLECTDPSTHGACNIEGYYSADQSFILDGINDCTVGPDYRLNIAGAVVVNASLANAGYTFSNQRDLCGSNLTSPTYKITNRLDFILNLPELLKFQNYTWRENAP